MEGDCAKLHHATQVGMRFKTYELFIFEIFHLIFFRPWWSTVAAVPWEVEPWMGETTFICVHVYE